VLEHQALRIYNTNEWNNVLLERSTFWNASFSMSLHKARAFSEAKNLVEDKE
jgi:hypothetical protein